MKGSKQKLKALLASVGSSLNDRQEFVNGKRHAELLASELDTLAYLRIKDLVPQYLPWSKYAMRSSGIEFVLNEILVSNKSSIVECGCGISTVYIAAFIKGKPIEFLSFENDRKWAQMTRDLIGPQQNVKIVPADLVQYEISTKNYPWYDIAPAVAHLESRGVDLLVVDGPKGTTAYQARYPAVPLLYEYFRENTSIILDDIERTNEKDIVERWTDEFDLVEVERRTTYAGAALLSRSGSTRHFKMGF